MENLSPAPSPTHLAHETPNDLPSLEILLIELRLKEIEMRESLIDHLREIDQRKLWRQAGYRSLAEFCETRLGYDTNQVRALLIDMDLIIPSNRLYSRDVEVQRRIDLLREWRRVESHRMGIAAFRIFNNRSLLRIAQLNPTTLPELNAIPGVGPKKVAEFGASVLSLLANGVEDSSNLRERMGGSGFGAPNNIKHSQML